MHLETPRLVLRPAHLAEPAHLTAAVRESLPELSRFMVWAQGGYTEDSARGFLAMAEADVRDGKAHHFLAYRKSDGLLVVSLGVHAKREADSPPVPMYEMGWWARSSVAGQGYATEAARALLEHTFTHLGARRVYALCNSNNPASARVMEKIGLEPEARLRNTRRNFYDGSLADTLVYAKLA